MNVYFQFRSTTWCYEREEKLQKLREEGCEDERRIRKARWFSVRGLRRCQNNECAAYLNRDHNAAINIQRRCSSLPQATLESMSTVSTVGGPLYSEYSDEYSEYSVSTVSGTQWYDCVPLSERYTVAQRYTDCVLCNTVHNY